MSSREIIGNDGERMSNRKENRTGTPLVRPRFAFRSSQSSRLELLEEFLSMRSQNDGRLASRPAGGCVESVLAIFCKLVRQETQVSCDRSHNCLDLGRRLKNKRFLGSQDPHHLLDFRPPDARSRNFREAVFDVW